MRNRPVLPDSAGGAIPEGASQRGYPLVLVGGFPCQDLSIAGRQAGLEGERSGLWAQFARAVESLRPDWIVTENVGHTWRRWVPEVRRTFARQGYASLPLRVRASDLGAPHERSRIFVVAHADREFLRQLSRWWCGPGRQMAKILGQSWNQEPGVPRVDDGIPNRVDRRKAIGNAIVPQIAQLIAKGIKEVTISNLKFKDLGLWSRQLEKETK